MEQITCDLGLITFTTLGSSKNESNYGEQLCGGSVTHKSGAHTKNVDYVQPFSAGTDLRAIIPASPECGVKLCQGRLLRETFFFKRMQLILSLKKVLGLILLWKESRGNIVLD